MNTDDLLTAVDALRGALGDNPCVLLSGDAIPDDEPVMIFRARDKHAMRGIAHYLGFCTNQQHFRAVAARLRQFEQWADAHPERMREPDTVLLNAKAEP